jgi:hypothetical protein
MMKESYDAYCYSSGNDGSRSNRSTASFFVAMFVFLLTFVLGTGTTCAFTVVRHNNNIHVPVLVQVTGNNNIIIPEIGNSNHQKQQQHQQQQYYYQRTMLFAINNNKKKTIATAKSSTTTTASQSGVDVGTVLRWLSPLNPYMLFVYPVLFIFLVDAFNLGPSSGRQ